MVAVGEVQHSQDNCAAEVDLGGLSAPLTLNSHRTFFLSGIFQNYQSLPVNSLTSTSIYTRRKQLLQKPVPMGNVKKQSVSKSFHKHSCNFSPGDKQFFLTHSLFRFVSFCFSFTETNTYSAMG